jgi:hypothetical protein
MIFKLKFSDKIEFAQAKDVYDLQEKYSEEYGVDSWLEVILITTIPDDEAKEIMLKNTDMSTFEECPEFSLFDVVCGDNFEIVGSTEWD